MFRFKNVFAEGGNRTFFERLNTGVIQHKFYGVKK